MKRVIIAACIAVVCLGGLFYAVYFEGFYLDLNPDAPVDAVFRTVGTEIQRKTADGEYERFSIRGVDVSSNIPGYPTLEFAPNQKDYLRWMEQIGEMGANTIRVLNIMDDDFYEALYIYNTSHTEPLYLLQGLQVSDESNYGAEDIYSSGFIDQLLTNSKRAVDVIHGKIMIPLSDFTGTGNYSWDVSSWVIGYLIGHEWDSGIIAFTNNSTQHPTSYEGTYFVTSSEATRFEAAMARVMDQLILYESSKYKTQRLVSFINDPSNDPFSYEELYVTRFLKYNQIDIENIVPTEKLESGYFASYRLYHFSPDFLQYFSEEQKEELGRILIGLDTEAMYHGYLDLLGRYHTIPVVAAGYGFSTARTATYEGEAPLTEQEQGESLVQVWKDASDAGWSGVFISTWQDTWERRTWNTSYATFDYKDPVWQDMQTEGQCYGLMEFRLGNSEATCFVDGDTSEWTEEDIVAETSEGTLSMQYDEKYLYFYFEGMNYTPETDTLYIPLDTTPQSGSTYCLNYNMTFDRACDFVLYIHGKNNSRIMVQERYEILWAMHAYETDRTDPYDEIWDVDSPLFKTVCLMIQQADPAPLGLWDAAETYETGHLRYGNGNPNSVEYDSLADFCFTENGVEIRIPWQLLNFASPAEMMIHDDYYDNYGVEYIHADMLYVGAALGNDRDQRLILSPFYLEGWNDVSEYVERLKKSYYIVKGCWAIQ